ncbi:hypothetical protein V3C10_07155 [[Clostridium] symbiosum]|uniref:hypothetical protein n=1 Tax=Clostridium symbiosum TaxID=1512 RepID=UPI001D06B89C|nr:hypothetical protein [[Clostridium] symbiosum]MCB6607150.1 hypothetical protein [[Clostridium] symbiosum]MCB6929710.1 hypothetical protein [[Clostridium] symbiosum]
MLIQSIIEGSESAVPETAGFEIVMAQGAKDAVSTVKGYDRIQSGYSHMPNLIVRYREDEMYIMAVPCPSMTKMEVDPDFILHITASMLKEVKLGAMGKVAFYFKDSSQFFAMTVTDFAIPLATQPVEHKNFKPYIKEFARRVNGNEQE